MATLQRTDELYHILEDEICALKILPGEALSENQLCKRFGVSRTPIRSVPGFCAELLAHGDPCGGTPL